MSKLSKLITNNNKLKTKITSSLKQGGSIPVKDDYLLVPSGNISINSETLNTPIQSETQQKTITLIDDSIVKGGYHVVKTLSQRDSILCCYRKQGMKVVVVGEDFSFKEYVLKSDSCDENIWEEIIINADIDESEVSLINDYSEISDGINSQMDLNIALKNYLKQLESDVNSIEIPTKTSELFNDGEDGSNPFITAQDIPVPIPQVNSDWNATSGKALIYNKPTKLSQFSNDEGFITIDDIPEVDISTKAETDASNLTPTNVISWRTALDIYSKSQVDGFVSTLDGKITTEKNRNDTQDGRITANETAIAGKVDKPTTDGSWVVTKSGNTISYTDASTFGKNISNANLSNTSARIFTQGNTFTWNTAGFFYYLKGLIDRTGNAAYTNVVVVHPTTGEMVTRDFADPQATTLAIQNASAGQKTTMRTALLGSTTPASPVLNSVSRRFVTRGVNLEIDLYGLNLTLLDPSAIWIEKPNGDKIYALLFYNKSGTTVSTIWNFPNDLPLGDYPVKIFISIASQGISTALFTVVNSLSRIHFEAADWMYKRRLNSSGVELGWTNNGNPLFTSFSKDGVQIGTEDVVVDSAGLDQRTIGVKSKNILLGNLDWNVELLITTPKLVSSVLGFICGVTQTLDTEFTNVMTMDYSKGIRAQNSTYRTSQGNVSATSTEMVKVLLSKIGSDLRIRVVRENGANINIAYDQFTVDTSKNYALFFSEYRGIGILPPSMVPTYGSTGLVRNYEIKAEIVG